MSETQRASFLYHLIIRQSLSKASLWLRRWIPRVASWVAPVVTPLSSHSFYTRFPHVLLFLGSHLYYFSTPLTTDQQQLPSWCSTLISNMLVLFTYTVIIDLLLIYVSHWMWKWGLGTQQASSPPVSFVPVLFLFRDRDTLKCPGRRSSWPASWPMPTILTKLIF